jgi:cytochrome P450
MTALPPGPSSQLLALLRYLRDPLYCLLPMARKYGDTFTFPGKPPMVCTGDPACIKAIYSADPETFAPLLADMADLLGRRSLLLLQGAEHRRSRKVMSPPFQGARMRAYGALMCHLAEARTAGWQAGQTVSVSETAQEISLDVILQAVFGVTDPARMAELAALLLQIVNGISPLLAIFPGLRREFHGVGPYASFLRRRRRLHESLDALIAAGRAAGPREDILSLLLAARDENGQPMSDEEIRDQLVLLVFAGHETTAIAIAWACHALHLPENAAALDRLRAELEGQAPDPEALAKLPYLEAVCQETLRRYPLAPASNPRRLLRPFQLGPYELPEGASVVAAIGLTHFREDLYPEPMRFQPERFLTRPFSPFEFIPFGGGARRCLGASMALYEMKLVLATLLRRFRMRPRSLAPDRGRVRAANVGPANGVRMVIEERRP